MGVWYDKYFGCDHHASTRHRSPPGTKRRRAIVLPLTARAKYAHTRHVPPCDSVGVVSPRLSLEPCLISNIPLYRTSSSLHRTTLLSSSFSFYFFFFFFSTLVPTLIDSKVHRGATVEDISSSFALLRFVVGLPAVVPTPLLSSLFFLLFHHHHIRYICKRLLRHSGICSRRRNGANLSRTQNALSIINREAQFRQNRARVRRRACCRRRPRRRIHPRNRPRQSLRHSRRRRRQLRRRRRRRCRCCHHPPRPRGREASPSR